METNLSSGFVASTQGISVNVRPKFLDDRSDPADQKYFWMYEVVIRNRGLMNVTLIHRHWSIIDSWGRVRRVEGEGVVGTKPEIRAGEQFAYSSMATLPSPSGIMSGHYDVQAEDGTVFSVEIPAFSLDSPYALPN